jgi:hypothetical protein
MRELGRFDTAISLLETPVPPDLEARVKRIRSLCEYGDVYVSKIRSGGHQIYIFR